MSEGTKHTPGRLELDKERGTIYAPGPDGYNRFSVRLLNVTIGGQETLANAHHIVACWNACLEIPTEGLEGGVVKELLEACQEAAAAIQDNPLITDTLWSPRLGETLLDTLQAAITKATPKENGHE